METFVPESKELLNRRTASGWDSHVVCKTLILWYPELLHNNYEHSDMREARSVLGFLSAIQEYPADLQDILLLLARRYGLNKAHQSLDNAIRKSLTKRQTRGNRPADNRSPQSKPDRLTA